METGCAFAMEGGNFGEAGDVTTGGEVTVENNNQWL